VFALQVDGLLEQSDTLVKVKLSWNEVFRLVEDRSSLVVYMEADNWRADYQESLNDQNLLLGSVEIEKRVLCRLGQVYS